MGATPAFFVRSAQPTCTGSPSNNLVNNPNYGYQWPNGSDISGYVCTTPPIGIYSAPRFAQCCTGPVHNITAPTEPGDESYPASCVAWCYVDWHQDITGNASPSNPYGFSENFLCNFPMDADGNPIGRSGSIICAFINDPEGQASSETTYPTATWNRISAQTPTATWNQASAIASADSSAAAGDYTAVGIPGSSQSQNATFSSTTSNVTGSPTLSSHAGDLATTAGQITSASGTPTPHASTSSPSSPTTATSTNPAGSSTTSSGAANYGVSPLKLALWLLGAGTLFAQGCI